ncbi:mechanosensitive ion channel family protein [Actinoplanes sp. CA-131856]
MEDMWRSVLLFIPTALGFAAIVLIGWLVARLLRTAATKGLARAGLDRSSLARLKITPSVLCGKIVYYGVLLFALQAAFGLWGPNPVSDLLTAVIAWLPRAFVAVVIVVVAVAVGRAAADLIVSALAALPYARLLARAVSAVVITLGVIAALDQVGIATSVTQPVLIAVLATIAGVIIVGVGGGLIRPMQSRWEHWLTRAATESTTIREQARAYAAQREQTPKPEPTTTVPATTPGSAPGFAPTTASTFASAEETTAAPATEPGSAPTFTSASADETQVIPPPRSSRAETPSAVPATPGNPDSRAASPGTTSSSAASPGATSPGATSPGATSPGDDDQTTTVITSGTGDTTIINPGSDDTIVIGADETQVIPPDDATTRPLPADPKDR